MMQLVARELWQRVRPTAEHHDLPRAHLRVAQWLAAAWVLTGQSFLWPGPLAWRLGFAVASTACCVMLVTCRFTRTCAALLAGLIAVETLTHPEWFAHNRLFVGAVLFTIALSTRRLTWLPRVQVGLVFALAALDKLLAPAWRDGTFVTAFLAQLASFGRMYLPVVGSGGTNEVARWLAANVDDGALAGGFVIALELAIAVGFFARWRAASWLNVAFHVGVLTLTGSTMGQFFFAGLATTLLLTAAPRVSVDPSA